MDIENTHIIFDGTKIIVSPNLYSIFDFLQKIEAEVNELFTLDKKLQSIRSSILDIMGLMEVMAKIISEAGLDFKYELKENPEVLAEKLELYQLTRIEMITVFCCIETIICLYIAYEYETDDDEEIRKMLMDFDGCVRNIILKLFLSRENKFFSKNSKKFEKVTAKKLRKLRNKLVHFFSVSGLSLVPESLSEKARRLEKIQPNIKFISSQDLYELYKSAAVLILETWSRECNEMPDIFERKIKYVAKVVKESGAILVKSESINV